MYEPPHVKETIYIYILDEWWAKWIEVNSGWNGGYARWWLKNWEQKCGNQGVRRVRKVDGTELQIYIRKLRCRNFWELPTCLSLWFSSTNFNTCSENIVTQMFFFMTVNSCYKSRIIRFISCMCVSWTFYNVHV